MCLTTSFVNNSGDRCGVKGEMRGGLKGGLIGEVKATSSLRTAGSADMDRADLGGGKLVLCVSYFSFIFHHPSLTSVALRHALSSPPEPIGQCGLAGSGTGNDPWKNIGFTFSVACRLQSS